MKGKVYIIGAGPGDPDLITYKGHRLLNKADYVLYDRLVSSELLELVSENCEKIYVGKHPGEPSTSQDKINKMLVEKASMGETVIRLKGGDPFTYGRGGEEANYLRENNVDYEIVPGITSAIAVPAYAGIPVTHRNIASSVAFVTGHEARGKKKSSVDWETLSRAVDTIVILMGVGNLPKISKALINGGRNASTPVALIENGTTSEQRVTTEELRNIAQIAKERKVKPPAIIIIGEVVNLREVLDWYGK